MHRHVSGNPSFILAYLQPAGGGGFKVGEGEEALIYVIRYIIHVFIHLYTTSYFCSVPHHPYTYIFH